MQYTADWVESAPNGVLLNGGRVIEYLDLPTPNFDRIRNEGVIIPRSYAGGPKCAPARFAVLTGRYPSRSQQAIDITLRNGDGTTGTDVSVTSAKLADGDNVNNIMQLLRNITAGSSATRKYLNGMVGKWHLGTSNDNGYGFGCKVLADAPNSSVYENCLQLPKDAGFDFVSAFFDANIENNQYFSHNPEWMVAESQKFINSSVQNNQSFFLYFSPTLTHTPNIQSALLDYDMSWTPKGQLTGNEIPSNTGMMSRNEVWAKAENLTYLTNSARVEAAGVIWIDDALGALMNYMDALEVLDNTFFVVMNDHGMGAKGMLYEHGARIFQYIRYPPLFGKNGYVLPEDFIVSGVDLAAVIAEIANIDTSNYPIDGTSWLQDVSTFIAGEKSGKAINYLANPPVCCEYRYSDVYNSHALITRDYKYIFRASNVIETDGIYATLYHAVNDSQQIYNLQADNAEQVNIFNTNSYAALSKDKIFDLQYLMVQYVMSTACPAEQNYECVVPNISYIPLYSDYVPPTPAPTPVGFTCDEMLDYGQTWRRVVAWDEETAGPQFLLEAEQSFLVDHGSTCAASMADVEYAYNFTNIGRRVDAHMIVCCPGGATFGQWAIPDGYKGNDVLIAHIWDDIKKDKSSVDIQAIVAINIAVFLVCCFGIVIVLIYYKRKTSAEVKQLKELAAKYVSKDDKKGDAVPDVSVVTSVVSSENADAQQPTSAVKKMYQSSPLAVELASSRQQSMNSTSGEEEADDEVVGSTNSPYLRAASMIMQRSPLSPSNSWNPRQQSDETSAAGGDNTVINNIVHRRHSLPTASDAITASNGIHAVVHAKRPPPANKKSKKAVLDIKYRD